MGKVVGKQHLTDQAITLFRSKGYSATSIDDIVKSCGITKGSLYYHFRSKEELALAAMDQVHRYFIDHVFHLIADVEHPGIAELMEFNQAVEMFFTTHPDGCLLANLSLEVGASYDLFKERIRHFFSDWRACYAKVFAIDYSPTRAAALAEDAVATVHGCILMHRIDGNIEPLRRQHRNLLALISREGPGLLQHAL
jgi:AcrR family transcriptional regulator